MFLLGIAMGMYGLYAWGELLTESIKARSALTLTGALVLASGILHVMGITFNPPEIDIMSYTTPILGIMLLGIILTGNLLQPLKLASMAVVLYYAGFILFMIPHMMMLQPGTGMALAAVSMAFVYSVCCYIRRPAIAYVQQPQPEVQPISQPRPQRPQPIRDPNAVECYEYFNLKYGDSKEEVKREYRQLMKIYHPDLHQGNAEDHQMAERVTRKANDAYSYLMKGDRL